MARTTRRSGTLSQADWASAALAALRSSGPRAVAVEPLARALGTTKGSFYWHFRSRAELLEAALATWEAQETDAVMAAADAGGSPRERLLRLFAVVLEHAGSHRGEATLFAHGDEPVLTEAVARVSRRRIGYVEDLLLQGDVAEDEAHRRAHLLFTVVLGLDLLSTALPERLPSDADQRAAWVASLVDMAFS